MATYRKKRVGDEIQRVLSERIVRGLKDPIPGFLTIREVEVNHDFTRAKVYYSIFGSDADKAEAQEVLDASRGYLRTLVGQKIRLRNTPELVFISDDSSERAARIHKLLADDPTLAKEAAEARAAREDAAESGADESTGDEDE